MVKTILIITGLYWVKLVGNKQQTLILFSVFLLQGHQGPASGTKNWLGTAGQKDCAETAGGQKGELWTAPWQKEEQAPPSPLLNKKFPPSTSKETLPVAG